MNIQTTRCTKIAMSVALIGLMLLMPITQVLADATEGFDSNVFTTGSAAVAGNLPSQWTWNYAPSGDAYCWNPGNLPDTGVEPLPNNQQPLYAAQSSPNIFEWNFNPSCVDVSTVTGTLSTQVIATSTTIGVNWYEALLNASATSASSADPSIRVSADPSTSSVSSGDPSDPVQPITCQTTYGTTALTVTVNSGTISPSGTGNLPCTTTAHTTDFTLSSSGAAVTVTEAASGTYTRWVASGNIEDPSFTFVATGETVSFLNYYQVRDTFTITPSTITGSCSYPCWDGAYSIELYTTMTGESDWEMCGLTVNVGTTTSTCPTANSWHDYDTSITVGPSTITDGIYKWTVASTTISTNDIGGGQTYTDSYARTLLPTIVTMPLKCYTNTGAATLTVTAGSGDSVSPSTLACSTSPTQVNFYVTASGYVVLTVTSSSPSNTAYAVFNFNQNPSGTPTAGSSLTINACSSGTCTASDQTFTLTYQIYEVYEATPTTTTGSCGSPCWDLATSISVTGTYLGTTDYAATNPATGSCPLQTAVDGGMVSCYAWFDYDTSVTLAGTLPDGDYSWTASSNVIAASSLTGTGNSTFNVNYVMASPVTATMPIDCTSTYGTATINMTVASGVINGGTHSTNLSCDGTVQDFTVSGGVVITLTEPTATEYTQYVFDVSNSASSTMTIMACASGTCASGGQYTFSDYYQVGDIVIVTPSAGSNGGEWDGSYQIQVTGYYLGTGPGQPLCTIDTTEGGANEECPTGLIWSDYGASNVVSVQAEVNDVTSGTWIAAAPYTFTPTAAGDNTLTVVYTLGSSVTVPIKASLEAGGGSTQEILITGCSTNPSQFSGDGSVNNIIMTPDCTYQLSMTSSNYDFLQANGGWGNTYIPTSPSCASGTCSPTVDVTYRYIPTVVHKNALAYDTVEFEILINGVVRFTNDTSTMPVCTTSKCNWIDVTGVSSLTVTPGQTYTVQFMVTFTTISSIQSDNNYQFSFAIDTVTFVNANPYIPGANVYLMDYSTNQLFNVSDYSGSSFVINYSALGSAGLNTNCSSATATPNLGSGVPPPEAVKIGNQCVVSNIETPDIFVPNAYYATLDTMMIGGSDAYLRSIIPCQDPTNANSLVQNFTTCDTVTVYLNNPSTVGHYTIQINDLSTDFSGSNVKIFVYSGTTLITSGYTDSQSQFPTALVPGIYKVILLNPKGDEYSTTLNVGTESSGSVGTLTIGIASVPFTVSTNVGTLSTGAAWNCDGTTIIAAYSDGYEITTGVTFTLEMYNWPGLSGTTTTIISGTSLNGTTSITLVINASLGVTTGSLVGDYLEYTSGKNIYASTGQVLVITANNATSITTAAFSHTPNISGGETFAVGDTTGTTLYDASLDATPGQLVGLYLEYTSGNAQGQFLQITNNTATTIYVNTTATSPSFNAWPYSPNPAGGDTFTTTGINGLSVVSSQTITMIKGQPMVEVTFNNALYSYSTQYILMANVTRTDGNDAVLGPVAVGSMPSGCNHQPSGFPYTPNFPNTLLGLNDVLPGPAAWLNLLALFIVLMTAALFGSRPASLGAIIVVAEAIVFAWAGWLPLITFYATLFMLAAIMLFLAEKARRRTY